MYGFFLSRYKIPAESFGPVCVVVDKIDKLPEAEVIHQLEKLGVFPEAVDGVLSAMKIR